MSETPHLRPEDAREILERDAPNVGPVDDTRNPLTDLRPGATAGGPTAFDVIGRSLVATRSSAETMIAQGMALVAQLDAALACLWLIAPPEHREALRKVLEPAGAGGASNGATAAPARARPVPPTGGPREKPRTFMDSRGPESPTTEGGAS